MEITKKTKAMFKANFKELFGKIAPYLLVVVLFVVIGYSYAPYTLSGKVVNQSDISSWNGMAHEIVEWNNAHPDNPTYWTNSMFSGMPATTISVVYNGDYTKYLYDALFWGQRPASYLILAMLGAFLMFLAFGVNIYLAFLGAIAFAFCSYNMQIIQVGHNTKMVAIALMPWVLGSVVLTYRKNSLLAALLFGLALSFQIKANHPQITYYLAIVILGYAIYQLIKSIKEKMATKFIKTSAALLVCGALGIASNTNHLWPVYEYGQHTMRGGTELSENGSDTKGQNGQKSRSGLDIEYATQWSYGLEETPNLFIPNFNGGTSSAPLGTSSATYKLLVEKYNYPPVQAEAFVQGMPLYWGPQAFTAGPMYMGAVCIFLAIFGLFVVRGGIKWWLAAVSLLALLLSFGYHFMAPTKFFFNYMPLYNKFRTVSMILVILQLTLPVLAVLALDRFFQLQGSDKVEFASVKRPMLWSLAICGGFALLVALIPSIAGSFSGAADSQLPKELAQSLQLDRASILRKDAIRSLIFVILTAVVLWAAFNKRLKTRYAYIAVIVIALMDLWGVDKRYLNGSHFVSQEDFSSPLKERPVDKLIKESDKGLSYRILDLSTDPFNNAYPSYHHKNIGGYSPAKLQRYQDLIERFLMPEINAVVKEIQGATTISEANSALNFHPAISMLNTRYIIVNEESMPLTNPYALGNCWIVNKAVEAENADMEIELLSKIDPRREAVINKEFIQNQPELLKVERGKSYMDSITISTVANDFASIALTSYAPNKMVYRYSSATPQLALFSEVYYPGWRALFKPSEGSAAEGEELEIFRANWILRGLLLPAGEGDITFTFQPESFIKGELYSRLASGTLLLLLIAACILTLRKKREC